MHPDLGIGGAENLIINVALGLESKGYKVKIYTPHYDPNRCFEECKKLDIEVHGNLFPRTIFGRFIALCAYIRMLLLAIWVVLFVAGDYDYFILDQVSFPIPILKLRNSKIMFYCHFPDKLLNTNRGSIVMRAYRYFLDYAEEITTGMAHTIVVNSNFTRKIFSDNFPIISAPEKKEETKGCCINTHCPKILYPPINLKVFQRTPGFSQTIQDLLDRPNITDKTTILTSLNRYERKKNIGLAIGAFNQYLKVCIGDSDAIIVIAGGWDPRVEENVQHE